jgi:prolipoprotein diacylglyceryl transferase
MLINWIYWDPPREAFTIPFIGHPVMWYGIWFALGFILAYLLIIHLFTQTIDSLKDSGQLILLPNESAKGLARSLADRLSWYAVIGTLVGARLGHVIFYDLEHYLHDPISIFKTWEGGLASHGGALGILVAMFFYHKYLVRRIPTLSFLSFLDIMSVVVPLGCICIRVGNFFNQEILGPPTTLPWAIIFGHPFDDNQVLPRHPTQLYEAFAYLIIFIILFTLWTWKRKSLLPGVITGLLFVFIFTSRFFIEFVKSPQGGSFEGILQTGQFLSLPFIILGFAIIFYAKKKNLKTGNLNNSR